MSQPSPCDSDKWQKDCSMSLSDRLYIESEALAFDRLPVHRPTLEGHASCATENDTLTVPLHPLKVKPAGNAYTATENSKSSAGRFSILPDELLIQFLEFLDDTSLLRLGGACKALYAFCSFEDLWKTLFVESHPPTFTWHGTWRSTHLQIPPQYVSRIQCPNVFSDLLHRPFFCAHAPLYPYTQNIPSQNAIPRLPNLSPTDFATSWTNKPFILTDPVREWPVYRDWSTESLLRKYSNVKFRAEAVDWPLKTYVEYMHNNQDESPLYLFDRSFAEKMNLQVGKAHTGHYWPPSCFGEDLFAVLGPQRPDSRWLIIGPERSGSTFHKDPNATSAWNAIIFGAKYWIAFPPSTSPPGVFVSPDQSEVTSPLSIPEWLLGFHAQARLTPGCKEGICYAGEVLHVPSGWWHLVVNLSASIAVTQNFVPRRHLGHVMAFLRDKREQVSGFASGFEDPYGLFLGRMGEVFPGVVEEAVGEMERAGVGRKRKWEELVKGGEESELGGGGGFSFGFGGEDEDEVP